MNEMAGQYQYTVQPVQVMSYPYQAQPQVHDPKQRKIDILTAFAVYQNGIIEGLKKRQNSSSQSCCPCCGQQRRLDYKA